MNNFFNFVGENEEKIFKSVKYFIVSLGGIVLIMLIIKKENTPLLTAKIITFSFLAYFIGSFLDWFSYGTSDTIPKSNQKKFKSNFLHFVSPSIEKFNLVTLNDNLCFRYIYLQNIDYLLEENLYFQKLLNIDSYKWDFLDENNYNNGNFNLHKNLLILFFNKKTNTIEGTLLSIPYDKIHIYWNDKLLVEEFELMIKKTYFNNSTLLNPLFSMKADVFFKNVKLSKELMLLNRRLKLKLVIDRR